MASQAQEHTQDTRHRLMEAALLAFAEKGYDSAGIREIAQNAKVNPAMIAYHFGNKEGLYESALRWVASDIFQWLENMPVAPDPNSPDARNVALCALKAHICGLFKNAIEDFFKSKGRLCTSLHHAAHKLWFQEMAAPRPAIQDFIIQKANVLSERIFACLRILRPELSKLELVAMLINIRGPVFLFHRYNDIVQKVHGEPFTDDDLKKMARHFSDFTLRGLGIPEIINDEGA